MLFYVNASYSVCVFNVNASHFVNAIVILFVNVMVEKLLQSKSIFVNAGNFVNVLEKELLQTKYPYL